MKKQTHKQQIDALVKQNALLIEANESLMKALPLIRLLDPLDIDKDEKKELIYMACQRAALLLKKTFDICDLKTHIETKIIFDEQVQETYKLSFTKV